MPATAFCIKHLSTGRYLGREFSNPVWEFLIQDAIMFNTLEGAEAYIKQVWPNDKYCGAYVRQVA